MYYLEEGNARDACSAMIESFVMAFIY